MRSIVLYYSHMIFCRPRTPAAKCLHLIRLREITSRKELIAETGLSQPTITRAVTALAAAGYITERIDLARANGRGRPSIPIELAEPKTVYAGIAMGTDETYIALFDLKGRTVRSVELDLPVAKLDQDDVIQHLMAGLNRLTAGLDRTLAAVGVTASGTVTDNGCVTAPNLGWDHVDLGGQMREQFAVPVQVSSVSAAIVGSEMQSHPNLDMPSVLALFADDSIACAVATDEGVVPVEVTREELTTSGLLDDVRRHDVTTLAEAVANPAARDALDRRASGLGQLAGELCEAYHPSTVVVAGSAFVEDPLFTAPFAQAARCLAGNEVELRLLPTHQEMVRDIARAAALCSVLADPLAVGHTGLARAGLGHAGLGHTGLGHAGLGHAGLARKGA